MRMRSFIAVSLLAAVLALACGGNPDDAGGSIPGGSGDGGGAAISVHIGIVQSLSGGGLAYGASAMEGMELAIEEFVAANPDSQIEYIVSDDQSTPAGGMWAYEILVGEGVDVILGPTLSNVGFEVLQYMQDQSLPAIAPITTAEGLSAIGDYVFRIALSEAVALPALVQRVAQDVSLNSAVLVYHSDDAYSRAAAEAMRAGVAASGGSIVREVDLAGSPDLDALLADPAVAGADAYLLPLLVEHATPLLQALHAAGNQAPVLGGEALAFEGLVDIVGDAANGMYVSSTWHPDVPNERSRAFVEAYRARYGHTPEHYAASSHAGVAVLFDAVQRAGTTEPQALRDAIAATANLDTVLGSLSMSEQGDAVFQPVFQRFEEGRLVILR